MDFKEAQNDMRKAYFGGGPGAFVSGIVWLAAGITALISTKQLSVLLFFFGGMLIYPLGMVISKLLKRSGKHSKGNPLSALALESTFLIFIGLFIAFFTLNMQPNWFYSIMILIIGGRYLIFSSIYGMRIYWLLGAVLVLAGVAGFILNTPFYAIALIGGGIEILFSFLIMFLDKNQTSKVML